MKRRRTKHAAHIQQLFHEHHMLSASDVSAQLPTIPFSTICRNIDRLVEDGVLREVSIPGKSAAYELSTRDAHDHFVCEQCEHVEAIAVPVIPLKKALPRGAHAHAGSMVVYGHCGNCAALCNV